ncbi:Aldo-keto reductase family 1 member C1-like protein [Hypsibius exemplaris]|uniref:Aldo-keto reductase family 1 member C1-like protein n=1 Tax=Hypsibius exemplaris TaxID=2072580 RepID=A0A1W0WE80_HYPEX|nr:Aldo-keto reductase family 1 member C1-like protein [Hypsibius exemplaris]
MTANAVPHVKLSSGLHLPMMGLGTSQFVNHQGASVPNLKGTREAVEYAIDIGYRHVDTAYSYGNEAEIGTAIRNKIQQGVIKREDLIVTTKLFHNLHRADVNNVDFRTPDLVLGSIKKSLKNLQLDYVDLYLIHAPMSYQFIVSDEKIGYVTDANGNRLYDTVDHADTWKALEELVDLGLAKSIGVSNFNIRQLQHLLDNCRIKPAVNQVENHAYLMQPQLWNKTKEELVLTEDPIVGEVAKRHSKSPTQVLIRYMIERGRVVIPRSTNPVHIKENFEIFDFEMSKSEMSKLDGLDRNLRFFPFTQFKDAPQFPFND